MTATKMIFISLPVADVTKSTAFYEAIGFEKNSRFSSEQASSLTWSGAIVVMVLDKALYATFTSKQVIDARLTRDMLIALSFESRAAVDAVRQGGGRRRRAGRPRARGCGLPVQPRVRGSRWPRFGPMWMDPAAAADGPPATADA